MELWLTDYYILGDAPHGVGRKRGIEGGRCTVVITLKAIIHVRTMLQIFIVIVHKFRKLHPVPFHMLPQVIYPTHIPQFPVQPEQFCRLKLAYAYKILKIMTSCKNVESQIVYFKFKFINKHVFLLISLNFKEHPKSYYH